MNEAAVNEKGKFMQMKLIKPAGDSTNAAPPRDCAHEHNEAVVAVRRECLPARNISTAAALIETIQLAPVQMQMGVQ